MGVRLYLNTDDVAELERAAGVPAGTALQVEQLENNFGDEFMEELYSGKYEHCLEYYQLSQSGFGKFDAPVDDYSGNAQGMQARKLFNSSHMGMHSDHAALEVIMPLINKYGVCWG